MYSKPLPAMQYAQQGLKLARQVGDQRGEARTLNRIGTIFRLTGNYDRSLEAHLNSVGVAETNHDIDALARTFNNLGNLYSEQKNSPKAIDYYRKTNQLAVQLGNLNLQRIALSNIGSEYAVLNQLDSALVYTQIAYRYALQLKVSDVQIELVNLANIYKRMDRNDLALTYYRKSIPSSIAVKNDRTLSQTYLEMAQVFRTTHQTDSVITYAKHSLKLAQLSGMLTMVQKASILLSEVYELIEPRQSITYLKLASAAKDSLINEEKVKNFQNIEFNERMRLEDTQRLEEAYRVRIIMYTLVGGIVVLVLIALILYRNNRQKQKANRLLQKQRDEINLQRQKAENAFVELRSTQAQLIQKEKLASLGELTAGIAHEIQNPLNFVNNFSEVSTELIDELREGPLQHLPDSEKEYAQAITDDLRQNLNKIAHHGGRASAIVKGMLEHSRMGSGEKQLTDINKLADEYLRLAYQGQRAKDKLFNCQLVTSFDPTVPSINIASQDIGRVLLNLYTNAFYAIGQQKKQKGNGYQPTLEVSSCLRNGQVELQVKDNGTGIRESIKDKLFQPFFTTKPTGEGTGLGLSLSYDIVTKGHSGALLVDSQEGNGSAFIVRLPV
jgi:signal transduction histidine kinase